MKKIFLALCIAAICASPSTAQDYDEGHISRFKCHRSYFHRHESGLVLGFPNRVDRSNRYEDFIKEQQYRYLMDRDILMFPSITLNGYYLYHFNDRIAVGGLMGWNPMFGAYMEHKVYTAPSTPQDRWRLREVQSGYIQGHIFSLMPTIKYTWLIGKHVTLYSKAGIGGDVEWFHFQGARFGTRDDVHFRLGYQITPFGIDFGQGPVRFFMEAGYGSEGVLMCGVNCLLRKVKR